MSVEIFIVCRMSVNVCVSVFRGASGKTPKNKALQTIQKNKTGVELIYQC